MYSESYNPEEGIIVPLNNYSPQSEAGYKGKVPALQRWSDVVFLTWMNVCGGDSTKCSGIKHFFRFHIKPKTTPTSGILLEALGARSAADVKIWPPNQDHIDGQTFDADSDEGKAILGTPHGMGIGWFFWQHQDSLGMKTIDKITVFKTTSPDNNENMVDWVNLHFLIKDTKT